MRTPQKSALQKLLAYLSVHEPQTQSTNVLLSSADTSPQNLNKNLYIQLIKPTRKDILNIHLTTYKCQLVYKSLEIHIKLIHFETHCIFPNLSWSTPDQGRIPMWTLARVLLRYEPVYSFPVDSHDSGKCSRENARE